MKFVRQNWHLVLLVGAILFFTAVYVPKLLMSCWNSDTVLGLSFYRDVVEQGHPARDWYWSGSSYIFPDLALIFFLHLLVHGGILVDQVCSVLFFLAWIGFLIFAYQSAGGCRPAVFVSWMVILVVALAARLGFALNLFPFLFFTCSHAGGVLCLIVGWALSLRAWTSADRISLGLLAGVTLLASASDPLFIICFSWPTCVSLLAATYLYRNQLVPALMTAGTVGTCSVIGYLGVPYVFPPHLSTGLYTQLKPVLILNSFSSIGDGFDGLHPYWVALTFLDLEVVVLSVACLSFYYKRLPPKLGFILINSTLVILMDWGAAILTGDFIGLSTIRYVEVALILPLVLILVLVTELIPWNQLGTQMLATTAAAITVACALSPPEPVNYWLMVQNIAPVLQQFKEEGIKAGLCDYWFAKSLSFPTDEEVPLRQIVPTGSIFCWLNTSVWYHEAPKKNPEFRFILMTNLDPVAIRARYGSPMRAINVQGVGEIWIYSPEDAISYHERFNELGNHHCFFGANSFSLDGIGLPSLTGHIEGTSRAAQAGKDAAGCLTYGPFLNLEPGQYCVELHYSYSSPPETAKAVTYEVTIHEGQTKLAQGIIPYHKLGPDTLTLSVFMPPDSSRNSTFETRTFYHGSGDFRINGLVVSYIGPATSS